MSKHVWLWGGVLLGTVLMGAWLILSNPEKVPKIKGSRPSLSKVVFGEDGGSVPEKRAPDLSAGEVEPSIHPPDPALQAELNVLRQQLKQRPDRETVLRRLRDFMARILAANPDRAAATLLQFLQSGADEATGLEFAVGEEGLAEWPSLRAFLLDLLGKIDPELASRYALETVIPAKASTVEYAVSLQILWNHGGAEKPTPELTQAWLGLLRKADWSGRPDPAWLESLDFASRIPEATPEFLKASTEWLADPENVVERVGAVDLALERMAVQQPVAVMGALLRDPSLLNLGRGIYQRSQIFARANLNDAGQQRLLVAYVNGLDPTSREAELFFDQFPCHNFSVGAGLSGQPQLQSSRDVIESDRAALAWLESQSNSVWVQKQPDRWRNAVQKLRQIVRAY